MVLAPHLPAALSNLVAVGSQGWFAALTASQPVFVAGMFYTRQPRVANYLIGARGNIKVITPKWLTWARLNRRRGSRFLLGKIGRAHV